ncbi:hypothetical protein O3P69_013208 [Scylla paramamosain]|uniref:Uncharacterized protein n=1 Tax=Scylla paramamosain TaxID=85552 RepID=A0AAW0TZ88_SCYPA
MKLFFVVLPALAALAASVVALPADERRVRAGDSVVYVGAVVEYESYHEVTDDGEEGITQENAVFLAQYAALAKAQLPQLD